MTKPFARAVLLLALAAAARAQGVPAVSVSSAPAAVGYAPPKPKAKPAPKKAAAPAAPAKKKPAPKPGARRVDPSPCAADTKTFCSAQAKKGRLALHDCLRAHASSLAPRCSAISTSDVETSCRNELGLLCSGLKAGGEEAMSCLREHARDATTECRNALDDDAALKR